MHPFHGGRRGVTRGANDGRDSMGKHSHHKRSNSHGFFFSFISFFFFFEDSVRMRRCLLWVTLIYGVSLVLISLYFFARWKLGLLIPPIQIRDYRLTRIIGEGQAGIVYKAEDRSGNKVAIKQIRSDRIGNWVTAEQEARVAKALQLQVSSSRLISSDTPVSYPFVRYRVSSLHNNNTNHSMNFSLLFSSLLFSSLLLFFFFFSSLFFTCYRFVEEFKMPSSTKRSDDLTATGDINGALAGERWLVFEYMDGGSLKDYLERAGGSTALSPLQASDHLQTTRDIMCQLFKALELLSRMRIIARDVKPSNIFLTSPINNQQKSESLQHQKHQDNPVGDNKNRQRRLTVKWGDFGDAVLLDAVRTDNLRAWWWDTRKETPTSQFLRPEGIVQDKEMTVDETLALLKKRRYTRSRLSSVSLWSGESWMWSHDAYGLGSILLSLVPAIGGWSGARDLDSRCRNIDMEDGNKSGFGGGVGETCLWRSIASNASEVRQSLVEYGGLPLVNLLSRLLAPDPLQRISPVEALFHPFLLQSPSPPQPQHRHGGGNVSAANEDRDVVSSSSTSSSWLDHRHYDDASRYLRSLIQSWADTCITQTSPYHEEDDDDDDDSVSKDDSDDDGDEHKQHQQEHHQQAQSRRRGRHKLSSDYPTLRDCYPPPSKATSDTGKPLSTEVISESVCE